ncbi:hypothetical protein NPX13_g3963 [Xylaria arbuscula]|uniref:Uncharacterized protein n=1 Tax=Xylaria arbuscula TaxID=114810 RepID=A0A9W8NGB8_9PEZI|nr:hypothetical protein NPX13_g3963 [Xylaria arbuscula]
MLVLHERGCVIDKLHIVCFNEFIDHAFQQVRPLLTYDIDEMEARVIATREELHRVITKEGFEAFWDQWIVAEVGRFAPLYPSPYNEVYAGETDPEPMSEEEVEAARKRVEEMLLMEA